MATANVLPDYPLTHAFSTPVWKAVSLEAFPTSPPDDVTLGGRQAELRVKILHFRVRHPPIFRPYFSVMQPTAELNSSCYSAANACWGLNKAWLCGRWRGSAAQEPLLKAGGSCFARHGAPAVHAKMKTTSSSLPPSTNCNCTSKTRVWIWSGTAEHCWLRPPPCSPLEICMVRNMFPPVQTGNWQRPRGWGGGRGRRARRLQHAKHRVLCSPQPVS